MEHKDESLVREVLLPMLGRPCWGVRQRWGSSLIFEFGEPHLQIHEPLYIRDQARYQPSDNPKVDKMRRRRLINPVGQWHLWLHMCGWRIIQESRQVAHSESDRAIIAKVLNDEVGGKILEEVILDSANGESAFLFEDDVNIDTWPIESEHEQFHVFEESGSVFVYRGDGAFWYGPGTTRPNQMEWWRSDVTSPICRLQA